MNLVHVMNVVATYSGLAKFGNVLIVTIQKKSKTESKRKIIRRIATR